MSDGDEAEPEKDADDENREEGEKVIKQKKQKLPPKKAAVKNDRGDYVVTSIDIPDMRHGMREEK